MGIRNGRLRADQVRAELLTVLERWGRLAESDIKRMMDVALAARFDADLRRQLERENLVRVEQVGDEPVLAITEAGRRWLEGYRRRRLSERRLQRRRGRRAPSREPAPGSAPVGTETALG